jgi:hypothetical protein
MAFIVGWPQIFNSWHREGLNSFGEPYAANAGSVKRDQLVSLPLKPQVVSGTTFIVGTMTSVRPRPRSG